MFYKNIMHKKIFLWNIRSFKKCMNFEAKLRKCISATLYFFLFKISTFKLIFPTLLFEIIRKEQSTLRDN